MEGQDDVDEVVRALAWRYALYSYCPCLCRISLAIMPPKTRKPRKPRPPLPPPLQTRRGNREQHPGEIAKPAPRRPSSVVQAEKAEREEAAARAADRQHAAILLAAETEERMAAARAARPVLTGLQGPETLSSE